MPVRRAIVFFLALSLAGCVREAERPMENPRSLAPPAAAPPPGTPAASTPRAPSLPWKASEATTFVDPLKNVTVRRLTSNPGDDDVFYQEPRSFGGPSRDLFLFRSDRGDGYRLYLANLTNGSLAVLSDDASFGWSPTWTADGREILVGHGAKLRFIDAATGAVREVPLPVDAWITFPHVSPEGKRVLFVEEAQTSGPARHLALALSALDGTGYRRLYTLDQESELFLDHPVWLDDTRVAFLTRGADRDFRGDFNKPYVLDLSTGNLSRLPRECSHYDPNPKRPLLLCGQEGLVLDAQGEVVFAYEGIHGHAAWAGDGVRFLATGDPVPVPPGAPHHGTIAILRLDSNETVDLAYHGSRYDSVAHTQPDAQWSADGGWIVWTSDREGNQDLYAIRSLAIFDA